MDDPGHPKFCSPDVSVGEEEEELDRYDVRAERLRLLEYHKRLRFGHIGLAC